MPRYAVLPIVFILILLPLSATPELFPEPKVFPYPNDDIYALNDAGAQLYPVAFNPYQLDLPDILPDFLDFVWVSTYEMYIKRGFSSTYSEIQAWSEWDECNFLFVCDNPTHTLSIKMEAAIKKAGKTK